MDASVEVEIIRDSGLELRSKTALNVGAKLESWIVLDGELIVEGFIKAVEWLQ